MYYQDYLDAIVRYYQQKKVNNELPARLLNPTPAKLKDECLLVYQSRYEKKDLKILLNFLEVNEGADVLRLIKTGRDRFKPLDNFLREGTENPEDRHIDLLGWLLDFEPRPFVTGYNYAKDKLDSLPNFTAIDVDGGSGLTMGEKLTKPIIEKSGSGEADTNERLSKESPPKEFISDEVKSTSPIRIDIKNIQAWIDKRRASLRVGGIAALGLITAIYFNNKGIVFGDGNSNNSGCMIWTGDYYRQVPCDTIVRKGFIVPLNRKRMESLRRITTPDTLRREHIENVWYRKRGNGRIDYYTDGGQDPVDPKADLHSLSEYMFNHNLGGKSLPGSIKAE